MSSGRSLQGNQVGAPCGWAATITPSLSSSHPASPSVLDFRIAGWPEYFTRTSNSVPGGDRPGQPHREGAVAVGVARRGLAVDADPRDAEAVQVQPEPGELVHGDAAQDRLGVEPVALRLVGEVEVVVGHVVRRVAVAGDVGIRAGHASSASQGADGVADPPGAAGDALPAHHQRDRSDRSVTPDRRRGQDHAVGPRVAPAWSVTRSMLSTRSWNRWVWTTQPWFTVRRRAARRGRSRAASRCHTRRPCPMRAPRMRSQTLSATVPCGDRGEPRRGQHLGEGVRELVAPHEPGPERVLLDAVPADQHPLRQRRDEGRGEPSGDHHRTRPAARRPAGAAAGGPAGSPRPRRRAATPISIGTSRPVSTTPRRTCSRGGGS